MEDGVQTLVIVVGVSTLKDVDIHVGVDIDCDKTVTVAAVGYWGGEREDAEGEESKSDEGERTHCRWLMSVGKGVTG